MVALLTDQRTADGIAATIGMALTVAAYVYLTNRAEPPAAVETCIRLPYEPSERGGQCYRDQPFALERTEQTQ